MRSDPDTAAFLASAAMDETADYLQHGRKFRDVPLPDLTERWINGFRALTLGWDPQIARTFAFVNAEFGLRGLHVPFNRVAAEAEALRDRVNDAAWLQRNVGVFLDEKNRPN